MKGVTPFLLCRFRLAKAVSSSALHCPKMDVDIKPLHPNDIISISDTAANYLKASTEYGAFDAIQFLAGSNAAEYLKTRGYIKERPSLPHASSSKHTLDDLLPSTSEISSGSITQNKRPRRM